jgi:DNA (cytosine-5)-methyltransferase 1
LAGKGGEIKFVSCFSGIEAASVALTPIGFECVGVAEVDKAASKVLAFHYPDVPNLGDVMAVDFIDRVRALNPDILVGGPPCQDFSIAGLRAGLGGNRGNLTIRWVEIIRAIRPLSALTENVPGWLSVNGGHDFGAFLAALVGSDTALIPPKECGGRWTDAGMVDGPEGRSAWRTLDAQFFGLAQRRRRVFVVFCPRGGADPVEVLFERQGLRGNTPPRREKREGAAGTAAAGAGVGFGGGRRSGPVEQAACLTAKGMRLDFEVETFIAEIASTLPAGGNSTGGDRQPGTSAETAGTMLIAHSLRGEGFDASEDGTGCGTPIVPVAFAIQERAVSENPDAGPQGMGVQEGVSYTLEARHHVQAVAFDLRGREGGAQFEGPHDTANIRAASGGSSRSYVAQQWAVRRLLVTECEALQGFPRNWTLTPDANGKLQADGPRYKQIGNSMAVNCIRWIGKRLDAAIRHLKPIDELL